MKIFFCTFLVDGMLFGIDVQNVQEVVPLERLTHVPRAPAGVVGIVNLRGQLVTTVDLRHRLNLPPATRAGPPMHVVLRTEADAVGLVVDSVGDVVEVDDDSFETPQEPLLGAVRNLVKATCRLPDRLLMVLDTDRAVEVQQA